MASIMIVEDEVLIAEDIRNSLDAMGYLINSVVSSGEEAVMRAEKECPDAVLMDIHLRDKMDGIEAAEKIYRDNNIPVIFLTAFAEDSLLDRAKTVGSFGYLLKPFEDYTLKAMIEVALYKKKIDDDRRQYEQDAMLAQKHESLRTLAGGIAHNFNNMLAGVLGNLELALDSFPDNVANRKYLLDAESCAKRAANLSRQMVTYLGQCNCKYETVDLEQEVRKTVEFLSASLPEKIRVQVLPPAQPLFIKSDPHLFSQLFTNLFQNSLEAIGDGAGLISLSMGTENCDSALLARPNYVPKNCPGEFHYLLFKDDGCGMDESIRQKALDPFYSTKFIGRGLGLPAALGVAQAMDGTLTLHSEQGKGTEVKAYFPAADPPAPPAAKKSAAPSSNQKAYGTILLIDQEISSREFATDMLNHLGFQTLTAAHAQDLESLLGKQHSKIRGVLLSINSTEAEGVKNFLKLRKILHDVPIVVSCNCSLETIGKALGESVPAGFIQRPYILSEIKSIFQEILPD